jgi:hypothetical protein
MVMKDLDEAGVQIWEYMRGERVALDSPTDVLVMQVRNYANAMQRASIRMHVLDKLTRNAKAGYSTGGRTYGYDNRDVNGPDGKRSHAIKVPNDAAAIVRRMFARADAGRGKHTIAKELTRDGIPTPTGHGEWSPATVASILSRPIYKGVGVYGRTQQKNKWGSKQYRRKPESEWMAAKAAGPAIVSVEQWDRVNATAASRTARLADAGPRGGKLRDGASHYLLTGNARCSCGAPFHVMWKSRERGARRPYYACYAYQKRGRDTCAATNGTHVPVVDVERAVINGITDALARRFDPAAIAAEFVAESTRRQSKGGAAKLRVEVARLERERAKYAAAIGAAGNVDVLLTELAKRTDRLAAVRAELDALTTPRGRVALPPANVLAKKIAAELRTFRATLGGSNMGAVRDAVRAALDGPLTVAPAPLVGAKTRHDQANTKRFEITGVIRGDRFLRAIVGQSPILSASGSRRTQIGGSMSIPFTVIAAAA